MLAGQPPNLSEGGPGSGWLGGSASWSSMRSALRQGGPDLSPLRLRAAMAAAEEELASVESLRLQVIAQGQHRHEALGREMAEVAEVLRQVRIEEHESILCWQDRVTTGQAEAQALQRRLSEMRSFLPPHVGSQSEQWEAVRWLGTEEATLRARVNAEAEAERRLQDQLVRAKQQLAGAAAVDGGIAGFQEARVAAATLHSEVVCLQHLCVNAEARAEVLRELATARAVAQTPADGPRLEDLVRRARDDLRRLHADMLRRYAELETRQHGNEGPCQCGARFGARK